MQSKNSIKISGYALIYNAEYSMSSYVERIAPGALDGADMTDVKLLFNHDSSLILASTNSGILKLSLDSKGLFFTAEVPITHHVGKYVSELVARSDVHQASWGFSGAKDILSEMPGGGVLRTITQVRKIFDVSPCTFAANPATSVWISLTN